MADNLAVTQGIGTTIAADDIAGVLHQRVKISQGADGVAADVSSAAPLQVTLANTGANTTAVKNTESAKTVPVATTMQSGAVANGNGTLMNVQGYGTALLSVTASIAMSGGTLINFEASVDDTTWVAINAHLIGSSTIGTTTLTTGDYRIDVSGYKSVRARISAYSAGTISVAGYVYQNAPEFLLANEPVNVAQLAGTTVDTNSGTKSAGTQRIVLATDQPQLTNALKVDGSAVTQPVSGNVGLSKAGTGYSISSQTALTTTATVSGSAGKLGGAMFLNLNSTPAYIQVFDTAGAVTLGVTTPTFVIPIPANSTAANGVGFILPLDVGIAIANGIKIAATTTATGSSTVATGLIGFVYYG